MTTDNKTLADVRNLIVCDTQFGWTGSTTLKMQEMIALQDRGWVVEGEDNLEFDLTDAGREVVARALQNAVQPTLADAQPGGRVRLGDALPPLPRTDYNAYSDGSEPLFDAQQMRDYARAALSAQPSPGGQGDARAQFEEYRGGDFERDAQGYYVNARTAQDWAMWQAALATRQPVGEPVGYATFRDGRFGSWLFQTRAMAESHDSTAVAGGPANSAIVPLFRSPAQAVDLGDFKALYRAYVHLLESGRDRIIDLGGTCDPVDVMEANDVDLQAARRVLDSQAVGNG